MNVRNIPRCLRSPLLGSATLGLTLLAAAASCHPAAGGDSEFWAPLPGAGGAPGSSAAGLGGSPSSSGDPTGGGSVAESSVSAASASSSSGSQTGSSTSTGQSPTGDPSLTFDFTTVTFHGQYSPKNVGAVWITDGQDVFVKTLEEWAVKRSKYLVKWKASSGGNTVDAVTGATRSQHVAHASKWDGTDVNGNLVADGVYRVYVEFTEKNGAGPWTSIEFTKGPAPVEISPADITAFTGQHLTYSQ